MKKIFYLFFTFFISIIFIACNNKTISEDKLNVYSRENGSGTYSAFMDFLKLKELNIEASITNNTNIMITSIKNDKNGIGYISYASANKDIKILKIDGYNINDQKYPFSRNFNIAYNENSNNIDLIKDFINYVQSNKGQKIINKNYEGLESNIAYDKKNLSGTINIGGSSSVGPLMEKLKEAYEKENPNIKINIQVSDSSTGIEQAINNVIDIAMSSRELKENEKLSKLAIAKDKIAVIVNKNNQLNDISSEKLKSLYEKKH